MNRVDRFIASCPSWEDFWQRTRQLSDAEKGRAFERLVQLYLQTEPEYRTKLRHVWTLREVPPDVCKRLDLPSRDEGIDLIACTSHGEYWAIQSKFRSTPQPKRVGYIFKPSVQYVPQYFSGGRCAHLYQTGQ